MLELFPEGFEELGGDGGALELAAYTNAAGEERIWQAFGGAAASDVEEDWQDRWRQFHKPVRVGSLWIGPPWEPPDEDATAVVIDPGRAFGTGGHPTTQLCLQLLEREATRERARRRLRLGCALDRGREARLRARAGVRLRSPGRRGDRAERGRQRRLRRGRVRPICARTSCPEAELALANIAADAVVALGPRLRAARAITSGYLVSDEPELEGYRRERRVESGGWAADLHVRQ